jgi:hypothetical protein
LDAFRTWRRLAVLAPLTLAACMGPKPDPNFPPVSDQSTRCATRIIVTFTEPLPEEPDKQLVEDLGRAAEASMTYVTSVAPDTFVFALGTREADPECEDAIERLRRHPRVRDIEIDIRMRHHG